MRASFCDGVWVCLLVEVDDVVAVFVVRMVGVLLRWLLYVLMRLVVCVRACVSVGCSACVCVCVCLLLLVLLLLLEVVVVV